MIARAASDTAAVVGVPNDRRGATHTIERHTHTRALRRSAAQYPSRPFWRASKGATCCFFFFLGLSQSFEFDVFSKR
jgi:hypothetical protein